MWRGPGGSGFDIPSAVASIGGVSRSSHFYRRIAPLAKDDWSVAGPWVRSDRFGLRPPSPGSCFSKGKRVVGVGLVLAILGFFSSLAGHPVSLTAARVKVEEEVIVVDFAMMVEDLYLFQDLGSSDSTGHTLSRGLIEEAAYRHQDFLSRFFHLRTRDGDRLEGKFVETDLSRIPEEGVSRSDLMAYWVLYQIEFDPGGKHDFLTVFQNFDGDEPRIPAEMDVRVYHRGVRVDRAVLGHGTGHTTEFDWEMDFDGMDEEEIWSFQEQLVKQRHEDGLGITSYSHVYNYLYITEREIRHEILIPLLTLDTWVPMKRENPEVMTAEEQEAVVESVFGFIDQQSRVEVDGRRVEPVLERLDFFGPEYRDFARESPPGNVSAFNARAGIVISYPVESVPGRVRFEWDHYDERMSFLQPTIYEFEKEGRKIFMDGLTRSFDWESEDRPEPVHSVALASPEPPLLLHIPVLTLIAGGGAALFGFGFLRSRSSGGKVVCLVLMATLGTGAFLNPPYVRAAILHPFKAQPELSEAEAAQVFQALLQNVYLAFQYREEKRIYDLLEQSVAGQLLEDLYLQVRRTLQMTDQGGAVSRVSELEFLHGAFQPVRGSQRGSQAIEYRSSWVVTGTVEHWGHIHTRQNRYDAIFTIEGFADGWRITDFEPRGEEQIGLSTRLRD